MALRSGTKGVLKAPEASEGAGTGHEQEIEEHRPRNMRPNSYPTEGFALEVDRKIKSQHPSLETATKVASELKRKFPVLHVTIYDASTQTRTLVEAAA